MEMTIKNIKADRMRYQPNRLSYWLCLLAILFDVCSFINIYGNRVMISDFRIGLDVIINILFMLITFMYAENAKTYKKESSYFVLALGIIQILRIFFVPLHYFSLPLPGDSKIMQMSSNDFIRNVIYMSLSGICLIVAAIICYIRSTILINHLRDIKQKS